MLKSEYFLCYFHGKSATCSYILTYIHYICFYPIRLSIFFSCCISVAIFCNQIDFFSYYKYTFNDKFSLLVYRCIMYECNFWLWVVTALTASSKIHGTKLKIGKWINRRRRIEGEYEKKNILRYHRISFYSLSVAKGIHVTAWNGGMVSNVKRLISEWGFTVSKKYISSCIRTSLWRWRSRPRARKAREREKEREHIHRKWRITPFVKARNIQ